MPSTVFCTHSKNPIMFQYQINNYPLNKVKLYLRLASLLLK